MANSHPRARRDQQEVLDDLLLHEPVFRFAIVAFVLLFGIVGTLATFAPQIYSDDVRRIIALAVCATTIPVAFAISRIPLGSVWWSNRSRLRYATEAFVVYADLGVTAVTAVTAMMTHVSAALLSTGLFAVIGAYAAHFVRRSGYLIHIAFTSAAVIAIVVVGISIHDLSVVQGIAQGAVMLLTVNGTVVLHGLYTSQIRQSIAHSHNLASTDALTGIANRRAFERRATRLVHTAPRGVTLFIVDVDGFKQINDSLGHVHGDDALVSVAESLERLDLDIAVVARTGADEYAIVATTDPATMQDTASHIERHVVSETGVPVSVGAACTTGPHPDDDRILSRLLIEADRDLYARKRRGDDQPGSVT